VEIEYDPRYILVTAIRPSEYFKKPLVLLNENNRSSGRIFYALSLPTSTEESKGKGRFLTLTLSRNPESSASGQTEISFLPKTAVHSAENKSPLPLSSENLVVTFDAISASPTSY
jgi:hypothetical protein